MFRRPCFWSLNSPKEIFPVKDKVNNEEKRRRQKNEKLPLCRGGRTFRERKFSNQPGNGLRLPSSAFFEIFILDWNEIYRVCINEEFNEWRLPTTEKTSSGCPKFSWGANFLRNLLAKICRINAGEGGDKGENRKQSWTKMTTDDDNQQGSDTSVTIHSRAPKKCCSDSRIWIGWMKDVRRMLRRPDWVEWRSEDDFFQSWKMDLEKVVDNLKRRAYPATPVKHSCSALKFFLLGKGLYEKMAGQFRMISLVATKMENRILNQIQKTFQNTRPDPKNVSNFDRILFGTLFWTTDWVSFSPGASIPATQTTSSDIRHDFSPGMRQLLHLRVKKKRFLTWKKKETKLVTKHHAHYGANQYHKRDKHHGEGEKTSPNLIFLFTLPCRDFFRWKFFPLDFFFKAGGMTRKSPLIFFHLHKPLRREKKQQPKRALPQKQMRRRKMKFLLEVFPIVFWVFRFHFFFRIFVFLSAKGNGNPELHFAGCALALQRPIHNTQSRVRGIPPTHTTSQCPKAQSF